jgi:hypothetical protein
MAYIGKNPNLNTLKFNGQSARPSNPVEGMVYYDDGTTNTEGLWKYQNAAWEFIGDVVDYKKLIPQAADPSSPVEGQVFYSDGTARAEGLWVYDGTDWVSVGAGISDKSVYGQFDAEDKNVTGFTNITITTSSPINEANSYSVDSYTASLPAVSLNDRNKNKTNSVTLHYTMTSGTAKLVVKDNTAAEIAELEIESSSIAQKVTVPYGVTSAMTSVQLEIQDVSSATGLKIDDVIFSDDPFVYKDLVNNTEWVSYTPSSSQGLGTLANIDLRWRREGSEVLIRGQLDVGTTTASEARLQLPDGLVASSNMSTLEIVGQTGRDSVGDGDYKLFCEPGVNYITFGRGRGANVSFGKLTGAAVYASGDTAGIIARIPIEGWTAASEHVITPAQSSETITKTLSSDVTSDGTIADLTVSDLKIGEEYEVMLQADLRTQASGAPPRIDITHDSTIIGRAQWDSNSADQDGGTVSSTIAKFVATATSITFVGASLGASSPVGGNGTREETYVQVKKIKGNFLAAIPLNYSQEKILSSDQSSSGTLTDLTFNNLIVGKRYSVYLKAAFGDVTSGSSALIQISHDSSVIEQVDWDPTSGSNNMRVSMSVVAEFTATASTVTFPCTVGAGANIRGNNTVVETYARITELNYTKETDRF